MGKLQKCKECGKEVSKNAKKCPHCGEPKPVSDGSGGRWLILFMFIFVGYLYISYTTNNANEENRAQQARAHKQKIEREKNHDIKYFKQSRDVIIKDINLKMKNEKYNDVIATSNKYVKYKGKDENIIKIIKEAFTKRKAKQKWRKAKQKCENIADRIKTLRYITAHNNNDQFKYEMDRLRTKEELEKFKLNNCNNSLSDNSWNPLTDGTINR